MIDAEELRDQLDLGEIPEGYSPNANIAPGQQVPIVRDPVNRDVSLCRWGLVPVWAKDEKIGYKMFNARAETIDQKPSFRVPLKNRRCLILADGFYEWKLEGEKKVPYLFTLIGRPALTFAGLWDIWKGDNSQELKTCTIITTSPNELLAGYHDRMPVILTESNRWDWISQKEGGLLTSLLKPCSASLMAEPIPVKFAQPNW